MGPREAHKSLPIKASLESELHSPSRPPLGLAPAALSVLSPWFSTRLSLRPEPHGLVVPASCSVSVALFNEATEPIC